MQDALQTVATLKIFYFRRSTSQHHAALQAVASHISAKVFSTPKTTSVSHVRKHGSNLVRNSQSMLSGGSACSNLAKAPKTRLPCLVSRRWGSTASDLTSASSTAEYSYDVICCNTCNTCNIFPGQAQHSNVSSPKLDG